MPRLTSIRTLALDRPPGPRMPAFLSAASGLVRAGRLLYVIGDDLHHLAVYGPGRRTPGSLVRLFPGTVHPRKKARKKRKRDLESLVLLPHFPGFPHGALLALGSGSRRRRRMGTLIALDAHQRTTGDARRVNLAALYSPLEREFGELNVEGAFVAGPYLALLQRAVTSRPRNARIRLKLAALLPALATGRAPSPAAVHDITNYELGAIDGIALGFTDGAALSSGAFAFTAVAEDTRDAYADGACAGSAIGVIGSNGNVKAMWRLAPPLKVEGIAVEERRRTLGLLVVTDADNPKRPARLLEATLRLR